MLNIDIVIALGHLFSGADRDFFFSFFNLPDEDQHLHVVGDWKRASVDDLGPKMLRLPDAEHAIFVLESVEDCEHFQEHFLPMLRESLGVEFLTSEPGLTVPRGNYFVVAERVPQRAAT